MMKSRKRGVIPLNHSSLEIHSKVLSLTLNRLKPYVDDSTFSKLSGFLRARDWNRLLRCIESFPDAVQPGVIGLYAWTQFQSLVKKYPYTEEEASGFDPGAVAWKKFLASEHSCKRINQRFRAMKGKWNRYAESLRIMRSYIESTIGYQPDLDKIYDMCDFGPGACVGVSGNLTNFGRKFLSSRWSVTPLSLSFSIPALWKHEQLRILILGNEPVCLDYELFRSRVMAKVEMVSHNNINFVPKTFKTLRSIASEPMLNGFVQKGIDQYLRQRLARVGLDLTDQSRNSEMARLGSMGGFNPYCTIDLSSASDSLSYEVVKDLLPYDWFDLLDRTRSRFYKYKGDIAKYHKFVSMGNGFCFPLQTLIFAAACYAVCVSNGAPKDFRVYGDDIVVRQSEALQVLELLKFLGFRNNVDKTFITGSFRESCGTDWYGGLDVRPVYLDFRFRDTRDLYKLHNATLRSSLPFSFLEDVRSFLRDICPKDGLFVRPFHGPPDSAFTVSRDICLASKTVWWNRETWSYSWKELVSSSVRDRLWGFDPAICNSLEYLAFLRGSPSSMPLAIRRKSKVSVRTISHWGPVGCDPFWSKEYDPG